MNKELLIKFLEFRKQFTKREWLELNQAIATREKEKADKLVLDDFDLQVIKERVSSYL